MKTQKLAVGDFVHGLFIGSGVIVETPADAGPIVECWTGYGRTLGPVGAEFLALDDVQGADARHFWARYVAGVIARHGDQARPVHAFTRALFAVTAAPSCECVARDEIRAYHEGEHGAGVL